MNHEEIMQKIVSGEMSIKQALESVSSNTKASDLHILAEMFMGKNVFIRTVTHHYTGRFVRLCDGFIHLLDVAWIADDGRFNEAIANGKLNEVEPYPDEMSVCVAVGSLLDICEWKHPLPRSVK